VRIPLWPGLRLSVWERQNPDAVKVVMTFNSPRQPIRRVLSMRGWMILLVRYDWRRPHFPEPKSIRRSEIEDSAWHSAWLHANWRQATSEMTTPQREYAADCVAAHCRSLAAHAGEGDPVEPEHLRWWRT
jgi:hypothetical protein